MFGREALALQVVVNVLLVITLLDPLADDPLERREIDSPPPLFPSREQEDRSAA